MGMFDYVNYEMDCPKCGTKVSEFQSKDGSCILAKLEFYEVDNFYTFCPECETWIEFTRPRTPANSIEEYKMSVGSLPNE